MGGQIISIGDSITITIFSVMVVFVGLIVLALLISVLKNISGEKKASSQVKDKVKDVVEEPRLVTKETDDEELVAVIAVAIAASLGLNIPDINIRNIRRIGQNTPAWAQAGKQERINNKL